MQLITGGKIIDINGDEVEYDLIASQGVRKQETWWEFYGQIKNHVDALMKNQDKNKPAKGGICKLCPWYNSCETWCEKTRDLTNVFYVSRNLRDRINKDLSIEDIDAFLCIDVADVMKQKEKEKKLGNKEFLFNIAEGNLQKALDRAKILYQIKKPVAYGKINFPKVKYELYFDIEDDPTQGFVYLHGIYERKGDKEQYVNFTATEISAEAEKRTWQKLWQYIQSLPPDDYAIYYYSHHEKTTYKRLQKRYPDVMSIEDLKAFFENPNVIDLYRVVERQTNWPVSSYSLKTLATYLGFKWRDETPSGVLSIQWFNKYLETKDESILKRIIEYNEDDCKATMVLKDKLEKL